jgi:GR25 family glycosyltransferase involved in LPS biosynthesis
MNIPIFCINLERATERRKKIEKLWIEELGFDITFWKGWDRRDIEKGKYYFPYNEEKTTKHIKRKLSQGEVACATSHSMIHEYCLNNNITDYIVMEDDIKPTGIYKNAQDLFHLLKMGKSEFPDVKIYLLHRTPCKFKTTETKRHFSRLLTAPWGNQISFYTNGGGGKMYHGLSQLLCLADHYCMIPGLDISKDMAIVNQSIAVGHHEYLHESTTYIGNYLRQIHRPFVE